MNRLIAVLYISPSHSWSVLHEPSARMMVLNNIGMNFVPRGLQQQSRHAAADSI